MPWWAWALVAYVGLLFGVGFWAAAARTVERGRSLSDAKPPLDDPKQYTPEARVGAVD